MRRPVTVAANPKPPHARWRRSGNRPGSHAVPAPNGEALRGDSAFEKAAAEQPEHHARRNQKGPRHPGPEQKGDQPDPPIGAAPSDSSVASIVGVNAPSQSYFGVVNAGQTCLIDSWTRRKERGRTPARSDANGRPHSGLAGSACARVLHSQVGTPGRPLPRRPSRTMDRTAKHQDGYVPGAVGASF